MNNVLLISLSIDFEDLVSRALCTNSMCECSVVCLRDTTQAAKHLDVHPCDLLMLDGRDTPWNAEEQVRQIMHRSPIPILLCNSDGTSDGLHDALEAGAVATVKLPSDAATAGEYEAFCRTMLLVSEIKVVKRWSAAANRPTNDCAHGRPSYETSRISVVAIGASAGGTTALQTVLSRLRAPFAVPIVVVQHISEGHIHSLARWLNEQSQLQIQVAEDGTRMRPGNVYLAPDDCHLLVDTNGNIRLDQSEKVKGIRPAISKLFESVLRAYGAGSIAVLLSGMGDDGAQAMRSLYDAGAMTVAQDKESSLIHGIPGEAIRLSAARLVLGLEDIGPAVNAFVDRYAFQDGGAVANKLEDDT